MLLTRGGLHVELQEPGAQRLAPRALDLHVRPVALAGLQVAHGQRAGQRRHLLGQQRDVSDVAQRDGHPAHLGQQSGRRVPGDLHRARVHLLRVHPQPRRVQVRLWRAKTV